MEKKLATKEQIAQAQRLLKAYELTGGGESPITLDEMIAKVVDMDEKSAKEYAEVRAGTSPQESL